MTNHTNRSLAHLVLLDKFLVWVSGTPCITHRFFAEGAPAVATGRQFLPALPGYVPVYIRTGDTPLEEINPDLAEAFNGYSTKHARKAFSRSNNAINDKLDDVGVEKDTGSIDDVSLDEDSDSGRVDESTQKAEVVYSGSQHIQKIPRAWDIVIYFYLFCCK